MTKNNREASKKVHIQSRSSNPNKSFSQSRFYSRFTGIRNRDLIREKEKDEEDIFRGYIGLEAGTTMA